MKFVIPGKIAAEAIGNLFSSPSTGNLPPVSERNRGLISYSPENCVACGLCMKDCPTGAIKVINEGTREEKQMHAEVDVARCIFCGQCADSCNKKCITVTPEFNLCSGEREELKKKL